MQGIKQYYPICASEIKIYRHDRKKVYADTFAVLKSQMDMHCLKKEESKKASQPCMTFIITQLVSVIKTRQLKHRSRPKHFLHHTKIHIND